MYETVLTISVRLMFSNKNGIRKNWKGLIGIFRGPGENDT
jgi:hypothetical protein